MYLSTQHTFFYHSYSLLTLHVSVVLMDPFQQLVMQYRAVVGIEKVTWCEKRSNIARTIPFAV